MKQRSVKFQCGGEVILGEAGKLATVIFSDRSRVILFADGTHQFWPKPEDAVVMAGMIACGEISPHAAAAAGSVMRQRSADCARRITAAIS